MRNIKMIKKTYIYILILGICFTGFILILTNYGASNKEKQISEKFPKIGIDSTFEGTVQSTHLYTNSIPKGALHITLSDGRKISVSNSLPKEIVVTKENIKDLFLYRFVQSGDTIMKPSGKDSLYVFKQGKKYTFYLASKEQIDSIMDQEHRETK